MSTTIRCGVASLDRTEHFPERCSLPRMKWKEKGVFLLSFFLVFLLVLMGRFYSKAALNVCLFVMIFYGLCSSLNGLDCMLPKHLKICIFTVGPSKRVRQVEHREFISWSN